MQDSVLGPVLFNLLQIIWIMAWKILSGLQFAQRIGKTTNSFEDITKNQEGFDKLQLILQPAK